MEKPDGLQRTGSLRRFLNSKAFMLLILIAAEVVFYSIISGGDYLTMFNLRNILSSMVVTAYLTTGAVFLMISGNIDLSTAQVSTIAGVVMAKMLLAGLPWPLAVLLTLAGCGVVGLLNSVLINELKFMPFVATMAVSYVVQGVMLLMTHGASVDVDDAFIVWLGAYKLFGQIPVNVVFTFAVFAVYGVVLAKTQFGKNLYMIGGNSKAALLGGLNPKRMWYILFINNALLGGVAGMLQAARLRAGTTNGIANGMFSGMTGAILGGVSFGGGSGGMGGAFIGLVMINAFNSGLTVVGVNPYWQTVASGALLLVALTFDYFNTKRLTARK
ncbi:MAG: ABC transporter permease [Oscillospiraceae bacterium]|jgi:ribose/xylose/arabinose/galactoside ABC-type transport system permease subunit|nr:ABC transporter permease [Oscillospiraceae bacterium]